MAKIIAKMLYPIIAEILKLYRKDNPSESMSYCYSTMSEETNNTSFD